MKVLSNSDLDSNTKEELSKSVHLYWWWLKKMEGIKVTKEFRELLKVEQESNAYRTTMG